jgi:hypothetical protein
VQNEKIEKKSEKNTDIKFQMSGKIPLPVFYSKSNKFSALVYNASRFYGFYKVCYLFNAEDRYILITTFKDGHKFEMFIYRIPPEIKITCGSFITVNCQMQNNILFGVFNEYYSAEYYAFLDAYLQKPSVWSVVKSMLILNGMLELDVDKFTQNDPYWDLLKLIEREKNS